jgi:hypothetical protein
MKCGFTHFGLAAALLASVTAFAEVDQTTPEKACKSLEKICADGDVDGYIQLLPPKLQEQSKKEAADAAVRKDISDILKVYHLLFSTSTYAGADEIGDKASVKIKTDSGNKEEGTKTIKFIKIDGKWYLDAEAKSPEK